MTQEDKELLLKYLCMALPYGVKIHCNEDIIMTLRQIDEDCFCECWENEDFKCHSRWMLPYLRPMSSMTEEESNELESITFPLMEKDWDGNENPACIRWIDIPKYMDFILSHHFDYRGLIEKGLAIEVTKVNNPYKE